MTDDRNSNVWKLCAIVSLAINAMLATMIGTVIVGALADVRDYRRQLNSMDLDLSGLWGVAGRLQDEDDRFKRSIGYLGDNDLDLDNRQQQFEAQLASLKERVRAKR